MRLTQEEYRGDPWGVLVTCCFLNKTAGRVSNPVIHEFLRRWPTPLDYVQKAKSKDVKKLIRHLGLQSVRMRRFRDLACGLILGKPCHSISGVGEYGRDSYAIFVEGRLDLNPADAKLKAYLNYRKSIGERRRRGRKQK